MTAQTTANECLEEIRFDNKYIVFFINENGNLSCAVMKKKIFSYEILRISGELSQSKNSKIIYLVHTKIMDINGLIGV